MYERFTKTISRSNKYIIHLAGRPSTQPIQEENIHVHTIFNRKRLHISRLWAPLKYAILIIKVKPKKVIVNTPELLIVTILNKILFGYKIYYDVQENHFKNTWHNHYYPPIIKHLLAIVVRSIELLSHPFINKYLLAEKCYQNEMAFTRKKSTVVENKYNPIPFKKITKPTYETWLIFSGTIAKHYGIIEAIELTKKLYESDASIRLKIVGYCQQASILKHLITTAKTYPFIELIGGDTLVPHSTILSYIEAADYGLLSYQYNKSTANRIPTKFYEHIALSTPMIIQHNDFWKKLLKDTNSCIFIDYKKAKASETLQKIKGLKPENISQTLDPFWDAEAFKLSTFF